MSTSRIVQRPLENKLAFFLTQLKEGESLESFSDGLCNAFAFLHFRSKIIGEEDKNLNRMLKIMEKEEQELKDMAELYAEYKNKRLLLVELKEGKDEETKFIAELNYQLINLTQQLSSLRRKPKTDHNNSQMIVLKKQIHALKTQRNELIETHLNKIFGSEKIKKINEAKDLYLYIHSLVGSFAPGLRFNFRIQGENVNQNDFLKILELLPPDTLLSQESISELEKKQPSEKVEKIFGLPFTFSNQELVALFGNKLHANTFIPGDLINLSNSDHSIFLSLEKDGFFLLYNPGLVLKTSDPAELVEAINRVFYGTPQVSKKNIGLVLHVYSKPDQELVERPSAVSLIKKILQARPPSVKDLVRGTSPEMQEKDINIQSPTGATALFLAAQTGNLDVVEFLINERKANPNIVLKKNKVTPLTIAVQNGHFEIVKVLTQSGAILDSSNKVESKKIRSSVIRSTPILEAIARGNLKILAYLIEAGANIKSNIKKVSPLWLAAAKGHSEMVKILILKGAEDLVFLNPEESTAATIAAKNGHAAVIKTLSELKIDLNKSTSDGKTPLHYAIERPRNFDTIKALLEGGANPYIPEQFGVTAIQQATPNNQAFILLYLLKKFIETHNWDPAAPEIAGQQLNRIEKAKETEDWESALKDVMAMAKPKGFSFSFFGPGAEPSEVQSYSNNFLSIDTLNESLSRLFDEDAPSYFPKNY